MEDRRKLRVVTYNVRRCLGSDGKVAPARIAEVLADCGADAIALQELDVGRKRTGGIDQALAIAEELGMEHVHFHPALHVRGEKYGDAIITALPSRLVKTTVLPNGSRFGWPVEPRGALWVAVDAGGVEVQVVNTHLGLGRRERYRQAKSLLGPDWLGGPDWSGPGILAGDLNSLSLGRVYRTLATHLTDAHKTNGGPVRGTFPSWGPLLRIDHVFVTNDVGVAGAKVFDTPLARLASDHLPLVVDVVVRRERGAEAALIAAD